MNQFYVRKLGKVIYQNGYHSQFYYVDTGNGLVIAKQGSDFDGKFPLSFVIFDLLTDYVKNKENNKVPNLVKGEEGKGDTLVDES
jgi:hypothetical protein